MPNPNGYSPNLVPAHPGNSNRLSHGAYSRSLPPEAAALAEALMAQLPHAAESDRLAVEEAAAVAALIGRVDEALAERIAGRGQVRALLDVRIRLSGRLERWLTALGATPQARAALGSTVASGSLAAELARTAADRREQT
jgi:hypothetical protein